MSLREYEARIQLVIDGGTTFTEARRRAQDAANDVRRRARSLSGVTVRRAPEPQWRLGNPFDDWKPRARKAHVALLVVFPVGVAGSDDDRASRWARVQDQLRAEAHKTSHCSSEPMVKVSLSRLGDELPLGWL